MREKGFRIFQILVKEELFWIKHVYVFLVSLFCFSFFNVAEAQIPEPNLVYLAGFDVDFNKNARKPRL